MIPKAADLNPTFRRSPRLAMRGEKSNSLQRAQDLKSKKLKTVSFASKVMCSTSLTPLRPSTPSALPGSALQVSTSLIEMNGGMSDPLVTPMRSINISNSLKESNGGRSDLPETSLRCTNIPLSQGDIQLIMEACGIVKNDKGIVMERAGVGLVNTDRLEEVMGGR